MDRYHRLSNESEHRLVADDGDLAMHHMDTSYSHTPIVQSPEITEDKAGIFTTLTKHRSTFNTEAGIYEEHIHVKHFDRNLARWKMLREGVSKLFITVFFSAAIMLCLKAWEGFRDTVILSKMDIKIFNSITIGLSLFLGMNLLSSLKQYATTFRWTFLSRRYVSLEVFDLILHLSSLVKVTQLMIVSLPGLRGRKFMRRFRSLKAVRDDGTKWMWLGCLLWLSINIGSQVLIALLSLFWPMSPSSIPILVPGTVAVADLTQWVIEDAPTSASDVLVNETALEAAWMYGIEATRYPEFDINDMQNDFSNMAGAPLYKNGSVYSYRFVNRNPETQFEDYMVSSRNISTFAICVQLEIKGNGSYSEMETEYGTEDYLEVRLPGEQDWELFFPAESAEGSVTWEASIYEDCGPRCTNFTIVQYGGFDEYVNATSVFRCNSSVTEVTKVHGKTDITLHEDKDSAAVYGDDTFARIAAGSMGWTGIPWGKKSTQRRTYSQGAKWSPAHVVTKEEVEMLLMRFTIGAIAAFDDHGLRYNIPSQTVLPIEGQELDVDWKYIIIILGGICAIQLFGLVLLLMFGTRTIVRDESFFSMAMLLKNVVGQIGDAGMNMTGDEIKDHPKLIGRKIRYDYHEGKDGEPNQVDIFFEGQGDKKGRRSWAQGSFV